MNTVYKGAAIAAALLGGPLAVDAAAQQGPVQTAQPQSVEAQLSQQRALIEQQNQRIDELQQQLREVTDILSNRVDRVENATANGSVNASNPGPRIEAPNGRNSLAFVGAVQATFGTVHADSDAGIPTLHGGTEIKRARIGLQGTAYNDFNYAVEFELAQLPGTSPSVAAAARDLWVQYNGFRPFSFTIGNMKPQTGLEASFSDRSNAATFMESSMMTTMLQAPGTRFVGVRASTGGEHWSTSLGLFGDDVNNNGLASPVEEGFGAHGRFTWALIADSDSLLHFGVSGYAREVATGPNTDTPPVNVGQLRVRAQPENTIDAARLIDTGNLSNADKVNVLAAEFAGFQGPFGFQGEWAQMTVEQLGARPDLEFDGGYASVNWFLTGESRVYDPRLGVFSRVSPRSNFDPSNGTWGALEVAARYSTLDLNDPALSAGAGTLRNGGEETNYTFGVNWYWNPYFRMMLNYVHADVDRIANSNGATREGDLDLIALRVQQEW